MTESIQATETMKMPHCLWMTENHLLEVSQAWGERNTNFGKQNHSHIHSVMPASQPCCLLRTTNGWLDYTSTSSLGLSACPLPNMSSVKRRQKKQHNCHGCTRGSLHGDQCPSQWVIEQTFHYDHITGRQQIA